MLDVRIAQNALDAVLRGLADLRPWKREVQWVLRQPQSRRLGDILVAGPCEDQPSLREQQLDRRAPHARRRLLAVGSDDDGMAAARGSKDRHGVETELGTVNSHEARSGRPAEHGVDSHVGVLPIHTVKKLVERHA
jgi:hypothetical protein